MFAMPLLLAAFPVLAVLPSATASLAPHAPIDIEGDSDLALQALAEGWTGSGSASDPYLIGGYTIDVTEPDAIAVRIRNVTHNVTIGPLELTGTSRSGTGIGVDRIGGLTIRDVTFKGLDTGIIMHHTSGPVLERLTWDDVTLAVDADGTTDGTLRDSTCSDSQFCFRSYLLFSTTAPPGFAARWRIENNTFESWGGGLFDQAVYLWGDDHTITGNRFDSSSGTGIHLWGTNRAAVHDNQFHARAGSHRPMYLGATRDADVHHNTFQMQNNHFAISLERADRAKVHNNTIGGPGNAWGIHARDTKDGTYVDNRIQGGTAIYLNWDSHGSRIRGNDLSGTIRGVYVSERNNDIRIEHNTMHDMGDAIAIGSGSPGPQDIFVYNNDIRAAYDGIAVGWNTEHVTIENNIITNTNPTSPAWRSQGISIGGGNDLRVVGNDVIGFETGIEANGKHNQLDIIGNRVQADERAVLVGREGVRGLTTDFILFDNSLHANLVAVDLHEVADLAEGRNTYTSTTGDLIHLDNVTESFLVSPTADGSTGNGLVVRNSHNVDVFGLRMTNLGGTGVTIESSTGIQFDVANVNGAGDDGVRVNGGSDIAVRVSLHVRNTGGDGLVIDGANGVLVPHLYGRDIDGAVLRVQNAKDVTVPSMIARNIGGAVVRAENTTGLSVAGLSARDIAGDLIVARHASAIAVSTVDAFDGVNGGIIATDVDGATFTNIRLEPTTGPAISLTDSEGILVQDAELRSSECLVCATGGRGLEIDRLVGAGAGDLGIATTATHDVRVLNSILADRNTAIRFHEASGLEVAHSHLLDNGLALDLYDTLETLVWDNNFDNDRDVRLDRVDLATWYVQTRPGPSVIGTDTIGGNAWTRYSGVDLDGDQIGDNPHYIETGNTQTNLNTDTLLPINNWIDLYPLVRGIFVLGV